MPNLLIRICDALFCVLLLCSAILAEGVEVSAGEQVAVGPLTVCFSKKIKSPHLLDTYNNFPFRSEHGFHMPRLIDVFRIAHTVKNGFVDRQFLKTPFLCLRNSFCSVRV